MKNSVLAGIEAALKHFASNPDELLTSPLTRELSAKTQFEAGHFRQTPVADDSGVQTQDTLNCSFLQILMFVFFVEENCREHFEVVFSITRTVVVY